MASPQKENGYTRIANEILENLTRTSLSGSAFSIILAIMRKTYGFNKKEDKISLSQLVEMVGLSKRAVIYNIQDLEAKGIIIIKRVRNGDKNEVNVIRFNKDYDCWVIANSAPQVLKNRGSAKLRSGAKLSKKVVQNSVESLPSFAPTKETLTKERTKDILAETSSALFSLQEEIRVLEESPRRDLNIIALYFQEKKPDLQNRPQFWIALKRHLRAAKDLVPFSDNQIIRAFEKSKKQTDEWTIETAVKNATK